MIRGIVTTAVVGLSLVGGAGAVTHDKDSKKTTVRIDENNTPSNTKDDATTTLKSSGKWYSCPKQVAFDLDDKEVEIGRVKITLKRGRDKIRTLEKNHPGKTLPPAVYDRYTALYDRDDQLTKQYNGLVQDHNKMLFQNCTK